jgi:dolichol-phosphate mannosyltransferase
MSVETASKDPGSEWRHMFGDTSKLHLRGGRKMEYIRNNGNRTVSVLLPALNEEDGIGEVIDSLPRMEISNAGYDLDILVVDGHSKDRTIEIAKSKGAKVVMQDGKGKGFGVRAGFTSVSSDYLVMMDADGTYPCEYIPTFLELLSNGADVVMGSRLLGSIAEGSMTSLNRAGNRLLSFMATALYGTKTTDLCTGMWGFTREAIDALELNSSGFEIESEMYAQSVKAGLSIHEVPICYSTREGETKLGSLRCGLRIALKLLRKRFVR